MLRAIHDQYRRGPFPEIASILKKWNEAFCEFDIVLRSVFLRNQDLVLSGVPPSRPVLIRPTQTKRHIAPFVLEHIVNGFVQQPLPGEPIVVIAERVDAVGLRQLDLLAANLTKPQVIKAEIRRQVRLIVAFKERLCLCGVGPFRETLTPPCVVLGYRMKLREVKCHKFRVQRGTSYL